MRIDTHDTLDSRPIWAVLNRITRKPLRQHVETLEISFAPTRKELNCDAKKGTLRGVMGIWIPNGRRIRIFLWPIINKAHWGSLKEDTLRYKTWETLFEVIFHEFGHAASNLTMSVEEYNRMTGSEEEELAKQYSKRYLWQAELNGLLTPPDNMGLIDAKISESMRRALNSCDGKPFEPSMAPYYRELIMKRLRVHHTLTKLVNRVNGEYCCHVDSNAYSDGERGKLSGFFRRTDSVRTKRQTIRALAEAMNLGTLYVDGAGRHHLYFSHKDYSSMLGVLFNGSR